MARPGSKPADTLVTCYSCYRGRLLVDFLADTWPTVKHHSADILTDSRWCWLLTDTPLIPHRYSTDNSPIYCWHTSDATSTDCWSICRPIREWQQNTTWQNISLYSDDIRWTLDRVSAGIVAGVSIDSPPRCWPIHWSTVPQKIHDPSLFGVDVFPWFLSIDSILGINVRNIKKNMKDYNQPLLFPLMLFLSVLNHNLSGKTKENCPLLC